MKTDAQVQKDVMEELKWQPSLKASGIGVAVEDGIVTLTGSVDSYAEKKEAEKAALLVDGVKGLAEDIQVQLTFGNKKDDTDIAKAAINMLHWSSLVPEEGVKVKVENGWVTAEGRVDWQFQKSAVRNTLANLVGIRGISNLVVVNPAANPVDVKKQITSAFERSATIDASKVHVENIGDKIILKGSVRSYAERLDAQRAAWNAPGVSHVDNQLEVKIPGYKEV